MNIRKATSVDANDLKELYFEHLSKYPPKEEQNMATWGSTLERFYQDDKYYLLVVEDNGKVVSSIQMVIIETLTHNMKPFAIVENVVTHTDYRKKGYGSALLQRATEIAQKFNCYKIFLETGSNRESTLNFYRENGFIIDEKHSCLKRL